MTTRRFSRLTASSGVQWMGWQAQRNGRRLWLCFRTCVSSTWWILAAVTAGFVVGHVRREPKLFSVSTYRKRCSSERSRHLLSPAITYTKADLEDLDLPEASFDLAYSSLTFHYIVNLAGLFEKVHRALSPGANLIFSIEHPIYMTPQHPDWLIDPHGRKVWPIDSYQREGARVTNWLAEGVIKHHRTIGTLLNRLIRAGLYHCSCGGMAADR